MRDARASMTKPSASAAAVGGASSRAIPVRLPHRPLSSPSSSSTTASRHRGGAAAAAARSSLAPPHVTAAAASATRRLEEYLPRLQAAAAGTPAGQHAPPAAPTPGEAAGSAPVRAPPLAQWPSTPSPALADLPDLVQEVCEALISLDMCVSEDIAFFDRYAELEDHIMEVLRTWRDRAQWDESRDGSRRPSSVYASGGLVAASGAAVDAASRAESVAVGGGGGAQRVTHDLDEASARVEVMEEMHTELSELEEKHRSVQRRYVVERDVFVALDELGARMESAGADEVDVQEDADGSQRRQRSRGYRSQPQERDVVPAVLAACRSLAGRVRSRCVDVADRITDELLWMRAEVARHDWTAVQASTALTRMDRVAALHSRRGTPRASAAASRRASLLLAPPGMVSAAAEDGEEDEAEDSAGAPRHSFVLRVQVPVFPRSTPPALLANATPTGAASGAEEHRRRGSVTAPHTLGEASVATVAVVATPARYALVQLLECCRDGLSTMLARLGALRARRAEEVERLVQDQAMMDEYDPAAADVSTRCAALQRYVAQLDSWAEEVRQVHVQLHERVKMPIDAALHTHDRLRMQLLEVLRQRLEEEAAAEAETREYAEDVEDEGERHATPPPLSHAATTSLPRASAEFVHMLEVLLRDQQAATAARERATATPPPPLPGDTAEPSPEVIERSSEAAVVDDGAATAAEAEQTSSLAPPPSEPHAEAELHKHSTVAVSEGEGDKVGAAAEADSGELRVAGRRRQREGSDEEDRGGMARGRAAAASRAGAEQQVEVGVAASSRHEPPRVLKAKSETAHSSDGSTDADVVECGSDSDNNSNDDDDDDDVNGSSRSRSRSTSTILTSPSLQPRRYALGSGGGLAEGLRAFFAAVVRRAMTFDDSDDEGADDPQPPSRKRVRRG